MRPPLPNGKNFTPRGQASTPFLTYGEYRKFRESFETTRFSNPSARSPLHQSSPQTPAEESIPQTELSNEPAPTPQPSIVISSRDPRRNPTNRIMSVPITAGQESSVVSPVHSITSPINFGTFKIPKKRQSESDLKSETSLSSEVGSDSEPELKIAEHESGT